MHGGVRYLEQLNFSLVTEALRERGLLYRNAPHLVSNLGFVVPRYSWWQGPFYGIGLKLYDALAGKLNLAPSRRLDRDADDRRAFRTSSARSWSAARCTTTRSSTTRAWRSRWRAPRPTTAPCC